jgi:hypothetical protein
MRKNVNNIVNARGAKIILLIGIAFLIGCGVTLASFFGTQATNKSIIRNGNLTVATVTATGSNLTVNGESRYWVEYEFHADGKWHTSRTGNVFRPFQIQMINMSGVIEIYYDASRNYRSVHASWQPAGLVSITGIVALVLGIIGCILITQGYAMIVKKNKAKLILARGVEGIGTYVGTGAELRVNNVPRWKVRFAWQDNGGKTTTSTSLRHYGRQEVDYYLQRGQIDIKFIGHNAIIVEAPFSKSNFTSDAAQAQIHQGPQFIRCGYCQAAIGDNETRCSNCGAPRT